MMAVIAPAMVPSIWRRPNTAGFPIPIGLASRDRNKTIRPTTSRTMPIVLLARTWITSSRGIANQALLKNWFLRQHPQIKSHSKASHARNPIAVRLASAQSSHCPSSVRRWGAKVKGMPQSRQLGRIKCSGTVVRLHSGQVLCSVRRPQDVHTPINTAVIAFPLSG
jgi:hypothetical protein